MQVWYAAYDEDMNAEVMLQKLKLIQGEGFAELIETV